MRLSFASVLVLCSVLPHFAFAGQSSGGGDDSVVSFVDASRKEVKLQQQADGRFEKELEAFKKAKVEAVDSNKSISDTSLKIFKENVCIANPAILPLMEKEVVAVYPESSTIRINRNAWKAIAKDETSKSFIILYSAYKLAGRSNANIVLDIQASLKKSGKCGLSTTPTYKPKSAPSAAPAGGIDGQG